MTIRFSKPSKYALDLIAKLIQPLPPENTENIEGREK
jgi:hypothetical protein